PVGNGPTGRCSGSVGRPRSDYRRSRSPTTSSCLAETKSVALSANRSVPTAAPGARLLPAPSPVTTPTPALARSARIVVLTPVAVEFQPSAIAAPRPSPDSPDPTAGPPVAPFTPTTLFRPLRAAPSDSPSPPPSPA